jgi:hypothetical protein
MAQVNSQGESCLSERDFELPVPGQGAQPSSKIGRIPVVFRAEDRAERELPNGMLAEGEELSSNPLSLFFNGL